MNTEPPPEKPTCHAPDLVLGVGECHPTAGSAIPEDLATCPECGGKLFFNQDYDTDPESDEPPGIDCENEPDLDDADEDFHRFWQSDWQPVIDKISAHFRGHNGQSSNQP